MMFASPTCSACHYALEQLEEPTRSGRLTVVYVPIVDDDSSLTNQLGFSMLLLKTTEERKAFLESLSSDAIMSRDKTREVLAKYQLLRNHGDAAFDEAQKLLVQNATVAKSLGVKAFPTFIEIKNRQSARQISLSEIVASVAK